MKRWTLNAWIDASTVLFITTLGKGHSITSILQFMSGREVLPILNSELFMTVFSQYCNEVPLDKIPVLLSVNLAVAKQISGLPLDGPVLAWIEQQKNWRSEKSSSSDDALDGTKPPQKTGDTIPPP